MTNDDITGLLKQSAASLAKATTELGDKSQWSPLDKGRTAANQVAECALIAAGAAGILKAKSAESVDMSGFGQAVAALASDTSAALAALAANTETLCAVVATLTEADAGISITMPWGMSYTLPELALLVNWNNTYHEGQINYIATLLA